MLETLNRHTARHISSSNFLFKKFFHGYLFLRERDRVQVGEGQEERETDCEVGSRLRAVSTEPDTGLKLTNREIVT